jgi:DNA-binding response OmpR family regulator
MAEILVIDDDPDIRALLFDTLGAAGHAVRVEVDGEAGLASAAGAPPDLVLLDWMMPGLSGLEVCHRLRADSHLDDVLVVMLTARRTPADIEWGYAAGVDAYVVKPFSPHALVSRVRSTLAGGRRPAARPQPPAPPVPRRPAASPRPAE